MPGTKCNTLKVSGASIYYEMCGSGPLLLVIQGGAGNAGSFHQYAEYLVDYFTVVTYDRRGFWRSPLDEPQQSIEIQTHSEDAHCLLTALGNKPASVIGFSIGALIGLDLTIRHPAQILRLVAHEPPVKGLGSDAKRYRGGVSLMELYMREGGARAITKFAQTIGITIDNDNAYIEPSKEFDCVAKYNRESFFKHDVGAVGRYSVDIDKLKNSSSRIVVAGGSAGWQHFPYQSATRLAEVLGMNVVEFPGNHGGCPDDPKAFAEKLRAVLEE